jgi:Tfp pilus assembly protein PilN
MKERKQFNYAHRWKIELGNDKQTLEKKKRRIIIPTVVSLLLVALLILPWTLQLKYKYELEKVEESIEYYAETAVTLGKVEELEAEVARMGTFIKITEEKSKKPRQVLVQINKLLPAGTTVSSFSLQADNSVQLGLVLSSPVDVARLWTNFRDSGLFIDFDIKAVSLTDDVQKLNLNLKLKQ